MLGEIEESSAATQCSRLPGVARHSSSGSSLQHALCSAVVWCVLGQSVRDPSAEGLPAKAGTISLVLRCVMPWAVCWGTERWDMLTTGWYRYALCQSSIPSDAGGSWARPAQWDAGAACPVNSVLWGCRGKCWQPALSCANHQSLEVVEGK